MRILHPGEFRRQPWKNGGGVTHEIDRADEGARMLWRLSIAEVATDGPFSAFPGLSRILTVIEGAGLWLDTPEGALAALPMQPLAFTGDLPVTGRLIDGPLRDFNLIFDAAAVAATVTPLQGTTLDCPGAPGRAFALLAVAAEVTVGGETVPAGALAQFAGGRVAVGATGAALLVRLDRR